MSTKAQLITELQNRSVNSTGILVVYLGEEKYDPNHNPQYPQTDLTGAVKKYKYVANIPQGKNQSNIMSIDFYVQDEGGPNEYATVKPSGDLDGLFRGEVQTYLDSLAPVYDYNVYKVNSIKNTCTAKVAISDGANGIKIIDVLVEKNNQGVFLYKQITEGTWNV